MRNLVVFLLALLATWIVLVSLAIVVLRWRLQRRNRVSPAVKSPAPVVWLWSPTHPARLHRRLRGAVAEIHLAPSRRTQRQTTSSVDDMRRELEYQAVEIDHHLVVAARHPRRSRKVLMATLRGQVEEVEQLSVRLSRLSRPAGAVASGWDLAQQPPEVLARLNEQLDLLDAAGHELDAIERAAGLGDVDQVLAPLERKVTAPVSPLAPISPSAPVQRDSRPEPPAATA